MLFAIIVRVRISNLRQSQQHNGQKVCVGSVLDLIHLSSKASYGFATFLKGQSGGLGREVLLMAGTD
jgi:hypothetical protein